MTKIGFAAFLLALGVAAGQSKPAHPTKSKPETAHLQFVKEYVRELIEDEDLKTKAEKEIGEANTPNEKLSAGIYYSKSTQLTLRSQIAMLKTMHLNGQFDVLIPSLFAYSQRQIDLNQKLINISGEFMAGPKPGVDYSALMAKMPEIRAELGRVHTTSTIFK